MRLSVEERDRLIGIVEKITNSSIGSQDPCGFCFSTSYALSILFTINEINHTIQGGKYESRDHFWINLTDYNGIIIDATIKQFDDSQDPIYIGSLADNSISKKFVQLNYGLAEWLHLYGIWREPLLDSYYSIPRDQDLKERLVINTFTAAAILLFEIDQLDHKENILNQYPYKFYFGPVYKGLREKWSKNEKVIELMKKRLPGKFDALLKKALK
jgi:hypothetical protein